MAALTFLLLVLLQLSTFTSTSASDCASKFPSTLSYESESELDRQVNHFSYGYYLFPLLKFQCSTSVTGILGYFLINPEEYDYNFYFQIWRPNEKAAVAAKLVKEIELDFADEYSDCQNGTYSHRVQCFINYTLPAEIKVEDHDYIGFYTSDNSLARPLFNETKTKTRLDLLTSVTNADTISGRTEYMNSSYPQIIVVTHDQSDSHAKQVTLPEKYEYAIISVAICVIIMILVIIAMIVIFKKKLKSITNDVNSYSYRHLLANDESERYTSINGNLQCNPYEVPDEDPFKQPIGTNLEISQQLSTLVPELPPDSIESGNKIGSGKFGMVLHGVWNCDEKCIQVAIKTLHDNVSEEEKAKLLTEAAIIGQFTHVNIIRLHGVITSKDLQVKMVMEYLSKGDLLNFLKSTKSKKDDAFEVNPQMLIGFARDIGRGMNYLSNKDFIHRDLAARNILLGENNVCKIADFGMARDYKDEDYYFSHGGAVPIKWTALEALNYRIYSTASDVWSYGIVLFEIWSLGESPYRDYQNADVPDLLDGGYRLPPPPGCPRNIYSIMIQCWNPVAKLRPKFSTLLKNFTQPSFVVFNWIEEDKQAGGFQCDVLGAPLEAGHNLYPDLQKAYKSTYVHDL